ncbi:MAG: Mini-ribonuclease 3 [Clostridia bacterium]|nr:Mini-ribonuclease 3 [Clostridia bacterium]
MNEANENPSQLAPLSLAHLGDAVYELYVRNRVIHEHPTMPAHKLHLQTVKYVKAHAQSNSINAIMEILTDDEIAVFRRGRNAKSYTVPKNANLGDYHRATGFEALMGYLYLMGDVERLEFIMDKAFINAIDTV